MELFDTNEILLPLALSVIVPVDVMPVLLPALVSVAVIDKLPPPALIVKLPVKLTIVVAVVALPTTVKLLPEIATLPVTAFKPFELAWILTLPVAVRAVPFKTTPFVCDTAVPAVIAPVVELMLPPNDVPTDKFGEAVMSAIKLVFPAPVLSMVIFAPDIVPEFWVTLPSNACKVMLPDVLVTLPPNLIPLPVDP